MAELQENCIEWYNGNDSVTVTLSQRKWITKVRKMSVSHSNDVTILHENDDGSIVARLPLSYVKLSPKRNDNLSDEQKLVRAERMREMRKNKKENEE